MAQLRRPSQFIRFDEIKRPFPPVPKQFRNYPILLSQIDEGDKKKVFEDDPKRYMSAIGTISPEDRRISTVVQFRGMPVDYGMEVCELHIVLPASNSSIFQQDRFMLSLFRLNSSSPIDVQTLAYVNRPSRVSQVARIIEPGTSLHWHRKFTCATEEILTYELTCSESPVEGESRCEVEWWQNKEDPVSGMVFLPRCHDLTWSLPAIYVIQHATV
ncbi:hypothetical protein B0H10DRAFT_1773319 [Mycena sp. CBHHK59/15]|nr:hypothetical protein B0H10DRAFT_1773319 [Mycena sp. CBHHK59/15]